MTVGEKELAAGLDEHFAKGEWEREFDTKYGNGVFFLDVATPRVVKDFIRNLIHSRERAVAAEIMGCLPERPRCKCFPPFDCCHRNAGMNEYRTAVEKKLKSLNLL